MLDDTPISWYNDCEVIQMPASEAKVKANARYDAKAYDKILLRIRRDAELNGDVIRTHAEAMGESVNAFLLRAITETIARDSGHAT